MKALKQLLKLFKVLKSFFPRRLPTGIGEFNEWVSDIILVSNLPDNDSTKHLAATFILHTPPTVAYLSIRSISTQLLKAAAYQVAMQVSKDTDPKKAINEQTKLTAASTEVVS